MLSSVEMFCWNIYVVAFFESKYQGLLTFRILYKVLTREGNYIFFCVSFIKHLRLNRTGMRSDKHSPHARLSQIDPYLHDFSTVCFSRFSLPLINQRSKFEFQMLKTFLFHILHVTQSRVSMGLTVSRKSVKKLAVRRKTWQIWTLCCWKKLNLKIIPSCNVLFSVILS